MTYSILINPIVLKVFLYRNNYTDRLLLHKLRRHFFRDEEGSTYVRSDSLRQVVSEGFGAHLRLLRSQPEERLARRVTSVYFLDRMLNEYPRLKYLHVQVLDEEQYTRKFKDDIVFDYRILFSKIDMSSAVDPGFLAEIKQVFAETGLYDHTLPAYDRPPYFDIQTSELVARLEDHRAELEESHPRWQLVENILSFFTNKLQMDDSQLLIVMEN